MPNYYNPYNFYPATYANQMGYSGMPQQMSMQQQPQQSYAAQPQIKAMEWVEGEVGAKAFQMPAGWPANTPIPLWDSTDTIIYLKSWGQMGIPNPMQKLRYEMPEQQNQALLQSGSNGGNGGMSGNTAPNGTSVTRQDLEQMKTDLANELRTMMGGTSSAANGNNQNGGSSGQNGNRGGNR